MIRRKFIFFLAVFLFLSFNNDSLRAQINEGGTPPSFNYQSLSTVPVIKMPAIDIKRLEAEDAVNDLQKGIPWRFGENLYTDLGLYNSGIWDVLSDGSKLWRLSVLCEGAYSINLAFNNYHLPVGAKLFVYNKDKSFILGAFTDYNNQKDGMFATTLIPGDYITIEYNEPSDVEFKGELNLWRVTHGYRGPYSLNKGFGSFDTCQRNAVCPEGAGWENQLKGECMLVAGGNGFCSGTLINNTLNNGTPYVITANHCYMGDPSTWVFWFNWKSDNCLPNTPPNQPSHNDISGAVLKARHSATDFCLVQLNSAPPANYNVYYAGWNRSTTPATSGMCIHHPNGDITKISRSMALRDTVAYSIISWKARWPYGPCTEPGSSGSPIYDQDRLFVGQLYGGPSACGLVFTSMWDVFGKFSVSWEGGGTPETRLKDWLDPNNSNAMICYGYDPAGLIPYNKQNTLNASIFPNPNTGSFSIDVVSEFHKKISLKVINIFGTKVYEKNDISVSGKEYINVDLSFLNNGIYFILLSSKDDIFTTKVIIEK